MPLLPDRARVVIIGGGVIGCSVAYHLGHLGWSDTVLLERDRLTSGTTWHAAGLVCSFGSMSETQLGFRTYTRDVYASLEEETGLSTGFAPIGFIELANSRDRTEEFRRVSIFNRYCGVDVHEIGPAEVAELFPMARVDDIEAGFYVPTDGRVNPADATMSLAKGARLQGVTIVEETPVVDVLIEDGSVRGVRTEQGDIECEYVVNCAGMWARQLGEQSGVIIPLQAAEHYYLITEPIEGVSPEWPVIEDPSSYGYYREETGGIMVGLFEAAAAAWNVERIPDDASFADLPPDWDRMAPYLDAAMGRVPVTREAGVRKFFCGPESFTPDLMPVVGEAPEVRGYFVAAGLNSVGILTGPGMGKAMAEWIVDGRPQVDVTGINIDRFQPYQIRPDYRAARVTESLGIVYAPHYPNKPMVTARGQRLSPIHDRLAAANAYFIETSGWESPGWYAPAGETPEIEQLSWGRENWFPWWQAEHEAVRTSVGLTDMSFMATFEVTGPDAGALLEWLSANRVDGDAERIAYTQWLDGTGRIEADLTVTKHDENRFWVVASDTAHRHVDTWMKRHAGERAVDITDLTDTIAQLNMQGPNSRELLQGLTETDLSNEAFPFRTARWIDVAGLRVLCTRITYVGELGYELYITAADAPALYDAAVETGVDHGLRHAGLKALGSLRMEKAYRDYGHDIDNTDNVVEAGLSFAVDLDTPFLGRSAVAEVLERRPLPRRLCQVLVSDPEPLMHHGEVVLRDGVPVGYVRAASYGFTLGGAVGLAMIEPGEPVTAEWLAGGTWTVDINGVHHPATVSLRPLYDPASERVRG